MAGLIYQPSPNWLCECHSFYCFFKSFLSLMNVLDQKLNVKIEVVARVLGKGKGTPMLRSGIKSIDTIRDIDTETEASDWQGFD